MLQDKRGGRPYIGYATPPLGLETSHEDSPYSSGGYEATYGTVTLDSASGTFNYHVEGALVQDLLGQDLPRAHHFVNDRLVLTSIRDDEEWRVTWRRA